MKHESLGQTARYWVGQDKQGRHIWKRAGNRFSLTRGRGHDGHIRQELQESSHSSMSKVYDNIIYAKKKRKLRHCELLAIYLLMLDYVVRDYLLLTFSGFFLTDCLFFCRLKINHDSHEFILEFGTVANKALSCYLH